MISASLQKLEKDIATLLLDKLDASEITLDRASQISKFILNALPNSLTEEQMYAIIPQLDDTFFELSGVVNTYLKEYQENKETQLAIDAGKLMNQGKIDETLKLLEAHIQTKI
jgi:hypothetical protein